MVLKSKDVIMVRVHAKLMFSDRLLPVQFRPAWIRLIKEYLVKEYPGIYQKYYCKKHDYQPFTWNLFIEGLTINKDVVISRDQKGYFDFSSSDDVLCAAVFNVLLLMCKEWLPLDDVCRVKVDGVRMEPLLPISRSRAAFQLLSPAFFSVKNSDGVIYGLCPGDDGFLERLDEACMNKYSEKPDHCVFSSVRQIRVRHYDLIQTMFIAKIIIDGSPKLLNAIDQEGLGQLTGGGFGYLKRL